MIILCSGQPTVSTGISESSATGMVVFSVQCIWVISLAHDFSAHLCIDGSDAILRFPKQSEVVWHEGDGRNMW